MPYSPDHKKGTRQRILKAAAHQFNKKGFSEASIEEIMTAAGLTQVIGLKSLKGKLLSAPADSRLVEVRELVDRNDLQIKQL
jgi:Bacterial regulatory proteins, tetR family